MKHILVADDEQDIIAILAFRFKKWGYRMTAASDGQQALDKAREAAPDLILLDFRMPILSGGDVCRLLKSDPKLKHIPVMIMTASSERAGVISALEFGADDGIVKPFEAGELLQKIKTLLKEN